jgi:hypothetical protein
VTPKNSRERAFAVGNDQVRGDAASFGAGVGEVVNGNLAPLLDGGLLDVERRLVIVVQSFERLRVLGQHWERGQE